MLKNIFVYLEIDNFFTLNYFQYDAVFKTNYKETLVSLHKFQCAGLDGKDMCIPTCPNIRY